MVLPSGEAYKHEIIDHTRSFETLRQQHLVAPQQTVIDDPAFSEKIRQKR